MVHIIQWFSNIGMRLSKSYFLPLKEILKKANMNILFETYVGTMVAVAVFLFIALFGTVSFTLFTITHLPLALALVSGFLIGIVFFFGTLFLFHSYPFHVITSKRANIETNLPFAANHMAAIAESGVPPFVLFTLVANIPEYGEVCNESRRVIRNVELFGMDVISAIKNVASRTPSDEYKQFLFGLISVVETGGDMRKYLKQVSDEFLFNYRIKREKYLQLLSTYADMYTAILIAAPLFFIAVLAILSLIGGTFLGMAISDAINIGIYAIIPFLNIAFLAFLQLTQPEA
ncbi:MAG: type II secretion system F family protein [Candidatus Aenigmarchaeota archaeon]|nr:type II secretion system F family protein [Candidatus Aenigmarchaeota archaeon]